MYHQLYPMLDRFPNAPKRPIWQYELEFIYFAYTSNKSILFSLELTRAQHQRHNSAPRELKAIFIKQIIIYSKRAYTFSQICGIIPLVWPFCLTAGRNLCNVNVRPLIIFTWHLATLWQCLVVDHYFYRVPGSLLSRECWYPHLPKRQRGAFVLIRFSSGWPLYANHNLKPKTIMPTNIWLMINENIFGSQVLYFLRGKYQ